jgi:hypothetical protein
MSFTIAGFILITIGYAVIGEESTQMMLGVSLVVGGLVFNNYDK